MRPMVAGGVVVRSFSCYHFMCLSTTPGTLEGVCFTAKCTIHLWPGLATRKLKPVVRMRMSIYSRRHYPPTPPSCRSQEGLTRYEMACDGCPSLESCPNCTIASASLEPTCSMALTHTTADEPGTELGTLHVIAGYWRANILSTNILACYNEDACRGGLTGETQYCDDGYTGPCERTSRSRLLRCI